MPELWPGEFRNNYVYENEQRDNNMGKRKKLIRCKIKLMVLCLMANIFCLWGWMPQTSLGIHAEETYGNEDKQNGDIVDEDEPYDLSELVGKEFEDARVSFGCEEPYYIMNFQYARKGSITLGRLVSSDTISYAYCSGEIDSARYSLCGVKPGMLVEDAVSSLTEDEYVELKLGSAIADNVGIFYNSDSEFFLQIAWDETERTVESVSLTACSRGLHKDKADVYLYYGLTAEEVMESVDGLAMRQEADEIYLEKDGIVFSGLADSGNLLNSVISEIIITGTESAYSIYGVCPGDAWEDIEQIGFDGGGSGELIDPAGRVLTFLYTTDEENPQISLK